MDGKREFADNPDLLETLACDITARPPGAPGFQQLTGALRGLRREPNALLVDFDPAVAAMLDAVVEAERLCCADIGWHAERDAATNVLRLRIEATPDQLDALTPLFAA